MCLARGIYFSRNTAGLPNARPASLRFIEQIRQVARLVHDAHAASAAAKGRFDDQRKPNFLRARSSTLRCDRSIGSSVPGSVGTFIFRQRARRDFITHQLQQLRTRTDERDPESWQACAKSAFSLKKSVAGMNHVDALLAGERHDSFDVQIRRDRPFALADQISFVRLEAMTDSRSSCA
jgi:hypothetical protein